MKVVSILVCLLYFSKAAPLTDEQKQKVRSYHQDCLKESNVNKALIEEAKKGIYTEDPAFKAYLFCFSQRVGFQNSVGVVQRDVFQKKVANLVEDQNLLAELVDKCTEEKSTPQDTSYHIAKCMRGILPGIEIFKVTPDVSYFSNEKAQKHLLVHQECASEDSLGEADIEKARKENVLFEDPKYSSYINCFFKKLGLQRDDGSLDREAFFKGFSEVINDNLIAEHLAEKCLQQQKDQRETAFFVSKCLHENSPVHVELFPKDIPIPDELARKIIENGRACIRETGVDREILDKSRQGIFVDDPKLKAFALCMSLKSEIINANGEIDVPVFKDKISGIIQDPVVVQKLIDRCALAKANPEETAFQFQQCFYKNSPGHLSLTQFGAVSEAKKQKRIQIIKECAEETGVPKGVVLRARKGDFEQNPLLEQYFFCINKRSGILNEDGEFKKDVLRKGLTEISNAEEAERLVETCARNLENKLEASYQSLKCFHKEAPEVAVVF